MNRNSNESSEIQKITDKHGKHKAIALTAQAARVSRRLLLAQRSEQVTVTCLQTGIVSLLDIPSIPGATLSYEHPLSNLNNCRGIAQQGSSYLNKLDTQVLAGVLLMLASDYNLFRFQPYASSSEKNAILRTAGKECLIDSILLIEDKVHNRNADKIPQASFTMDADRETIGAEQIMRIWLQQAIKHIETPDTTVYDEYAPPIKSILPVYTKDVLAKQKRVSFMEKKERIESRKEHEADKKILKNLVNTLFTDGAIVQGMRAQLISMFAGLETMEHSRGPVYLKMSTIMHPAAEEVAKLFAKKRMSFFVEDDLFGEDSTDNLGEASGADHVVTTHNKSSEEEVSADIEQEDTEATNEEEVSEPKVPEGLSPIAKILWLKKYQESFAPSKKRNIGLANPDIISATSYNPSTDKQNMGKE